MVMLGLLIFVLFALSSHGFNMNERKKWRESLWSSVG